MLQARCAELTIRRQRFRKPLAGSSNLPVGSILISVGPSPVEFRGAVLGSLGRQIGSQILPFPKHGVVPLCWRTLSENDARLHQTR